MRKLSKIAGAIFVWIAVLAGAVYVYHDFVNAFLGTSIASSILLVILILVDLIGPFSIRWLDTRENEHTRHLENLRKVFEVWNAVSPGMHNEGSFLGEDLILASYPLYLRVDLFPSDHFTNCRALEHLKAEKYLAVRKVLERISKLQDDHNASVSLLLRDIKNDIESMLRRFPSLKEREPHQRENYFYAAGLDNAIQNRSVISFNRDNPHVLEYAGVAPIADIADSDTRKQFFDQTTSLIEKYRNRLQSAIDERSKMVELLAELKGRAGDLIDGIDTYHRLEGKCDFEKQ